MTARGLAAALVLVMPLGLLMPLGAGCFHPVYDRPACAPDGACPNDLMCVAGVCEPPGTLPPDAAAEVDAPDLPGPMIDATEIDAAPTTFCVGTFHRVCIDPPPTTAVTLMTQQIDTTTSPLCAAYSATPEVDACVIAGSSITVPAGAIVRVTGAKPLILVATTIAIAGTLDVASHRIGLIGPGADVGPCVTDFVNPTAPMGGSGGGWGGSFAARGGDGGRSLPDGQRGIAASSIGTRSLRGGCGGGSDASGESGQGGRGGGGLALVAVQLVTIDGVVNASGAGGRSALGTFAGRGGGGGGSGGMIVLDAAAVVVSGQCFANGGGGAEGSSGSGSGAGTNGGESSAAGAAGAGGSGQSLGGGDGGQGSVGASHAGISGQDGAQMVLFGGGGGGGGGSAGVIMVFATTRTGTDDLNKVSPPPG